MGKGAERGTQLTGVIIPPENWYRPGPVNIREQTSSPESGKIGLPSSEEITDIRDHIHMSPEDRRFLKKRR